MRLDERIVRLAVRALPAGRREARLEEWLADLDGCQELGLGSWSVVLGAVRSAAMSRNIRAHIVEVRPRTWITAGIAALGIGVLAIPGVAIAAYAADQLRGIVTVEPQPDGTQLTLHWRDYPAIAGVHPSTLRTAPTLEEGLALGERVTEDIRGELAAVLPLEWVQDDPETGVIQPTQNGFGGVSMLHVVNTPAWHSTVAALTAEQIDHVTTAMTDVANLHGFTQLTIEPLDENLPTEFRAGTLSDSSGQWLSFSVGTPPGQESDTASPTIILMYGANGLLPAADQTQFEQKLEPFLGYAQPAPLQS